MRPRSTLLPLFLSFVSLAAYAQATVSLDDAVSGGVRYLQGRFPQGTRAVVSSASSENPQIGASAARKLSTALVNDRWFTVVERGEAAQQRIAEELELHENYEMTKATTLSVGRQLGAQIIILSALNRVGQNWKLEIDAFWAESAQLAGQWSAVNIRPDPAWASPASAGVTFAGDALGGRERQTITDGLKSAMQARQIAMELDENPADAAGYGFTVTVYREQTGTGGTLIKAEALVSFSRNGRELFKTVPYRITETTDTLLARRIAERLRGDGAFFNKVAEAVQ